MLVVVPDNWSASRLTKLHQGSWMLVASDSGVCVWENEAITSLPDGQVIKVDGELISIKGECIDYRTDGKPDWYIEGRSVKTRGYRRIKQQEENKYVVAWYPALEGNYA